MELASIVAHGLCLARRELAEAQDERKAATVIQASARRHLASKLIVHCPVCLERSHAVFALPVARCGHLCCSACAIRCVTDWGCCPICRSRHGVATGLKRWRTQNPDAFERALATLTKIKKLHPAFANDEDLSQLNKRLDSVTSPEHMLEVLAGAAPKTPRVVLRAVESQAAAAREAATARDETLEAIQTGRLRKARKAVSAAISDLFSMSTNRLFPPYTPPPFDPWDMYPERDRALWAVLLRGDPRTLSPEENRVRREGYEDWTREEARGIGREDRFNLIA